MGNLPEAISAGKNAVSLAANYADSWYNLGLAQAGSRLWNEAIAPLTNAVKQIPDYSEA